MAIITVEQYEESLRKLKPVFYIDGEKMEGSVLDNPHFRTNLNIFRNQYRLTQSSDPKERARFVTYSDLVDEEVSFWTSVPQSSEDLQMIVKNIHDYTSKYFCIDCMCKALDLIWAASYDCDKDKGTKYHENVKRFFTKVQKNDERFVMGVMDAKGDRTLKPSQQPDPDMFVRVIEKNDKGIVVRGCKSQVSGAACAHYVICIPGTVKAEGEENYAVAFAVPVDAKGLKFVVRPAAGPLQPKEYNNPMSSEVGVVECVAVFDDVFIPWEDVFLCGEWEYTRNYITYLSSFIRTLKGTCTAARIDMMSGFAQLMADANGIANATHIRNKLTDMAISANNGYSAGLAAAVDSTKHPSGLQIPNIVLANSGLYVDRLDMISYFGTLMEIGGGAVTTMPLEKNYVSEAIGEDMHKYMKGKAGTADDYRYRALSLVQDITASMFTGYFMSSIICAGGTPETNRVEVYRNHDFARPLEVAKACAKLDGKNIWNQD